MPIRGSAFNNTSNSGPSALNLNNVRSNSNDNMDVKAGRESKERMDRTIASYRGILSHCDSYGLRQSLNNLFRENGMVTKRTEAVSKCIGDCQNCPNYTESYFCGFVTPYCKLYGFGENPYMKQYPDTAGETQKQSTPKEKE